MVDAICESIVCLPKTFVLRFAFLMVLKWFYATGFGGSSGCIHSKPFTSRALTPRWGMSLAIAHDGLIEDESRGRVK